MDKTIILQELTRRKCKSDLWNFCLYMNKDFFNTRPELEDVANSITELYFNEGGKINISLPRRTGKSTLSNHIVVWLLLLNEDNSILRASYNQTTSEELNQGARDLFESQKFKVLWNKKLEIVSNSKAKLRFKNKPRSSLIATSVGGGSTGYGANIIIADDVYKDHNEALSDTINNKTITWYYSAFKSSLDKPKKDMVNLEIIIGTLWRVGELTDELQNSNYFDKTHKIKALNDDNKSFNENVISTKDLLKNKELMHPMIFNSMYQQSPMISLEPVVRFSDLNFIDDVVINYQFRLCLVDWADSGSDRTALSIVDVCDNKIIVRDLMTDPSQFEKTMPRVEELIDFYKPTITLFEANHNEAMLRLFKKELSNRHNIELFKTTKNKENKIIYNAPLIKKMLFLRTKEEEYNKFIRNFCKYDLSKKSQHDDEIDNLSMVIEKLIELKEVYKFKYWEE